MICATIFPINEVHSTFLFQPPFFFFFLQSQLFSFANFLFATGLNVCNKLKENKCQYYFNTFWEVFALYDFALLMHSLNEDFRLPTQSMKPPEHQHTSWTQFSSHFHDAIYALTINILFYARYY